MSNISPVYEERCFVAKFLQNLGVFCWTNAKCSCVRPPGLFFLQNFSWASFFLKLYKQWRINLLDFSGFQECSETCDLILAKWSTLTSCFCIRLVEVTEKRYFWLLELFIYPSQSRVLVFSRKPFFAHLLFFNSNRGIPRYVRPHLVDTAELVFWSKLGVIFFHVNFIVWKSE